MNQIKKYYIVERNPLFKQKQQATYEKNNKCSKVVYEQSGMIGFSIL